MELELNEFNKKKNSLTVKNFSSKNKLMSLF